jgi:hypothetical protein
VIRAWRVERSWRSEKQRYERSRQLIENKGKRFAELVKAVNLLKTGLLSTQSRQPIDSEQIISGVPWARNRFMT